MTFQAKFVSLISYDVILQPINHPNIVLDLTKASFFIF